MVNKIVTLAIQTIVIMISIVLIKKAVSAVAPGTGIDRFLNQA